MTTFKKILLVISSTIVISALAGYIYFDRKFSPEDNYLQVTNESGKIPLKWTNENKNALLLPIHFQNDSATYYLQFDTGAPSTIFYENEIKKIPFIKIKNGRANAQFNLGNTTIKSENFKVIPYEKSKENDSIKIIGTLGSDILDQRKTLLNFKENYVILNLQNKPSIFKNQLSDFQFKKRKIIFEGTLNGKNEKFLYDSGSSAFELLTNKEIWTNLKSPKSTVLEEKSKSWDRVLTSFTASSNESILFGEKEIPLKNVTYVEGFSQTQLLLMKFSGMTGMLGNKIFLNHVLYFDAKENKMGIQ